MRKITFLVLPLIAFLMTSCGSFTEEIYINEDGSGKYMLYTDMIPSATKMALSMAQMFSEVDSTGKKLDEKELMKSIEEKIWKDFPEDVDSTFSYDEKIPDSIKSDPAKMKILERMTGFMEGGKDKGYMNIGVSFGFGSFNELEEFLALLEDSQKSKAPPGGMANISKAKTDIEYKYSGSKISRTTKILNKPEMEDKDLSMIMAMMGDAKMKTVIHLPKKVKKANGNNLVQSEGKTVIFEHNLIDMLQGKSNSDFEIILKK